MKLLFLLFCFFIFCAASCDKGTVVSEETAAALAHPQDDFSDSVEIVYDDEGDEEEGSLIEVVGVEEPSSVAVPENSVKKKKPIAKKKKKSKKKAPSKTKK